MQHDVGYLCRECEEELEEMKGQQQLCFGTLKRAKAEASSGAGRHAFWRANKLQRVSTF